MNPTTANPFRNLTVFATKYAGEKYFNLRWLRGEARKTAKRAIDEAVCAAISQHLRDYWTTPNPTIAIRNAVVAQLSEFTQEVDTAPETSSYIIDQLNKHLNRNAPITRLGGTNPAKTPNPVTFVIFKSNREKGTK